MPGSSRRQFGASSLSTIMQMVANGFGTTLLPAMALPVEFRQDMPVKLFRFAPPGPSRSIGLAWRRTSTAGAPRGLFCGIGVCFDCIVTVNGDRDVRACMRRAADGDEVLSQHDALPEVTA